MRRHTFAMLRRDTSSAFEFEIQGEKYRVMQSMDQAAYNAVMQYVLATSGHDLTVR